MWEAVRLSLARDSIIFVESAVNFLAFVALLCSFISFTKMCSVSSSFPYSLLVISDSFSVHGDFWGSFKPRRKTEEFESAKLLVCWLVFYWTDVFSCQFFFYYFLLYLSILSVLLIFFECLLFSLSSASSVSVWLIFFFPFSLLSSSPLLLTPCTSVHFHWLSVLQNLYFFSPSNWLDI